MSFSVRLTKCWRETTTKRDSKAGRQKWSKTRGIKNETLGFCTLQVLPICRLSHDTQFHYQIMAGISCIGGVRLLNSSPTRTVGPTHTPAHSGGVAHLSELFAKIAAPPHPGEASGPSTAPARSRPSDRALPAAG